VDGAADTPDEFLVRGTLLELQTGIVDGLEELAGALKKERAKLRTPLVGQEGQEFTSMRL
jgi:hypothetical protein